MADLKPCPFCGGEAETCLGPIRGKWGTRCKNCDVWRDDRETSEAEAIAAWNRRALPLPPEPPLADDVAGVVEGATAALDGVTPGPQPLVKWLRNPWENNHSVERGPIPQWLHALMLEAADLIERLAGELAAGSFYKEADIDALMARAEKAEAEVARLRDGHLQIIREFGDTPNGHRAAEISRAALEPKGADHE